MPGEGELSVGLRGIPMGTNVSNMILSKKYSTSCLTRSFGVLGLAVAALLLAPDTGWSQQPGQNVVHRIHMRDKENPVNPAVEPTSPLGQALASCDKDAAAQETFALPGLKGEVTLDRCYKGHGHLICVFDALIAEAKSLTDSYTKDR
jgi:hypothetical protein